MRIVIKATRRIGNAHRRQRTDNFGLDLFPVAIGLRLRAQDFGNLFANSQHRIERSHGLLKDHGHALPAHAAHLSF